MPLEERADFDPGDLIAPKNEEFNEYGLYYSTEEYYRSLKEKKEVLLSLAKEESISNPFFHGYSMGGVPKDWGIKRSYLELFGDSALRAILRGKHNVILPDPMRNVLNLDEQVAIELATGLVKPNKTISHVDFPDDAYLLIRRLDSFTYDRGLMAPLSKKILKKPHPTTKGSRESRIYSLDPWILDQFVASFKRDYDGDFYLSDPSSDILLVKNQILESYRRQYSAGVRESKKEVKSDFFSQLSRR